MATNPPAWDWQRKWAVTNRAQYKNPKTSLYVKKDMTTGKFMDNKTTLWKFKWVANKSKTKTK